MMRQPLAEAFEAALEDDKLGVKSSLVEARLLLSDRKMQLMLDQKTLESVKLEEAKRRALKLNLYCTAMLIM